MPRDSNMWQCTHRKSAVYFCALKDVYFHTQRRLVGRVSFLHPWLLKDTRLSEREAEQALCSPK